MGQSDSKIGPQRQRSPRTSAAPAGCRDLTAERRTRGIRRRQTSDHEMRAGPAFEPLVRCIVQRLRCRALVRRAADAGRQASPADQAQRDPAATAYATLRRFGNTNKRYGTTDSSIRQEIPTRSLTKLIWRRPFHSAQPDSSICPARMRLPTCIGIMQPRDEFGVRDPRFVGRDRGRPEVAEHHPAFRQQDLLCAANHP